MATSTTIYIVNPETTKLRPWTYVAKDIILALNRAELAATTTASASDAGVVLLSNDYSSTDAAATGVSSGTAATPKAVYDAFEAAKAYTDSAVTSVYRFKGSVNTVNDLPSAGTEGLTVGDVYNVKYAIDGNGNEIDDSHSPDGVNYAWTGSGWDSLGGILSIETAINGTTGTSSAPVSASAVKSYVDGEVSTLNSRIDSEVSAINATIDSEVSSLNDRIDSEVSALEAALASEVSALNETIASEVSSLNDRIDSEVSAIEARLDGVVGNSTITKQTKESGSTTTITKDSDQVIFLNTNGTQTLSFTKGGATDFAQKYIYLHAQTDTTMTYSGTGVEWADAEDTPIWGKANYNLYFKATWINEKVILQVLSNDQEVYNIQQYLAPAQEPEPEPEP